MKKNKEPAKSTKNNRFEALSDREDQEFEKPDSSDERESGSLRSFADLVSRTESESVLNEELYMTAETLRGKHKSLQLLRHNLVLSFILMSCGMEGDGDVDLKSFFYNKLRAVVKCNRTPDLVWMNKKKTKVIIADVKVFGSDSNTMAARMSERDALTVISDLKKEESLKKLEFESFELGFDENLTGIIDKIRRLSARTTNKRNDELLSGLDKLKLLVIDITIKTRRLSRRAETLGFPIEDKKEAYSKVETERLSYSEIYEALQDCKWEHTHHTLADRNDDILAKGRFTDYSRPDLTSDDNEFMNRLAKGFRTAILNKEFNSGDAWKEIKPFDTETFLDELDNKLLSHGYTVDNSKIRPILPLPFVRATDLEDRDEYSQIKNVVEACKSAWPEELKAVLEVFTETKYSEEEIKMFNGRIEYVGKALYEKMSQIRESQPHVVKIKSERSIGVPTEMRLGNQVRRPMDDLSEAAVIGVKKLREKDEQREEKDKIVGKRAYKSSTMRTVGSSNAGVIDELADWFVTQSGRQMKISQDFNGTGTYTYEPQASKELKETLRAYRSLSMKYFTGMNIAEYLNLVGRVFKELMFLGTENSTREIHLSTCGFKDFLLIVCPGPALTESTSKRSFMLLFKNEMVCPENIKGQAQRSEKAGEWFRTKWLKVTPAQTVHYSSIFNKVLATSMCQFLDLPRKVMDRETDENKDIIYFFGYVPIMALCNKRVTSARAQLARYASMAALSESADLRGGLMDKLNVPVRNEYDIWIIRKIVTTSSQLSGNKKAIEAFTRNFEDEYGKVEREKLIFDVDRMMGPGKSKSFTEMISDYYVANLIEKTDESRFHHEIQVMNDIAKAEYNFRKREKGSQLERDAIKGYSATKDDVQFCLDLAFDQSIDHICYSRRAMNIGAKLAIRAIKESGTDLRETLNAKYPFATIVDLSNTKSVVSERTEELPKLSPSELKQAIKTAELHRKQKKTQENQGIPVGPMKGVEFKSNKRQKNIQTIHKMLKSMKPDDHIPSLDEAAKPHILSRKRPYANFFSKEQIGSSRDIAIQDAPTKISNAFIEYLSRELCKADEMEMLTDKAKFERQRRIVSERREVGETTYYLNADNTKWGPHMMPTSFTSLFHPLRKIFDEGYIDRVCVQLNKMSNKLGEFPRVLVEFFCQDGFDPTKLTDPMRMLYEDFKKNRNVFDQYISMWQGILHYTSSWNHVARQRFLREIFELSFPEYAQHVKIHDQVSSDDRGSTYTINHKEHKKIMMILNILDRWVGKYFNTKFNEMKTCLSRLISEFNQNFMAQTSSSSAPMKFLPTITVLPPSSNFDSDLRFVFSTISQIESQGLSLCSLQLLMDLGRVIMNDLYRTGAGQWNETIIKDSQVPQHMKPTQLGGYPDLDPLTFKFAGLEAHTAYLMADHNSIEGTDTSPRQLLALLHKKGADVQLGEDIDVEAESSRIHPNSITWKVRQTESIANVMESMGITKEKILENQKKEPFSLFLRAKTVELAVIREESKFASRGIQNAFSFNSAALQRVRIASLVRAAVCEFQGSESYETPKEKIDWEKKVKSELEGVTRGSGEYESILKNLSDQIKQHRQKKTFKELVEEMFIEASGFSSTDENKYLELPKTILKNSNLMVNLVREWLKDRDLLGLKKRETPAKFYLRKMKYTTDFIVTKHDATYVLAKLWGYEVDGKFEVRKYTEKDLELDKKVLLERLPWLSEDMNECMRNLGYTNQDDALNRLRLISDVCRVIQKSKSRNSYAYITSNADSAVDAMSDVLQLQSINGLFFEYSTRKLNSSNITIDYTDTQKKVVITDTISDLMKAASAVSLCESTMVSDTRYLSRKVGLEQIMIKKQGAKLPIGQIILHANQEEVDKIGTINRMMKRYLDYLRVEMSGYIRTDQARSALHVRYDYTKPQKKKGDGSDDFDLDSSGEVVVQIGSTVVRLTKTAAESTESSDPFEVSDEDTTDDSESAADDLDPFEEGNEEDIQPNSLELEEETVDWTRIVDALKKEKERALKEREIKESIKSIKSEKAKKEEQEERALFEERGQTISKKSTKLRKLAKASWKAVFNSKSRDPAELEIALRVAVGLLGGPWGELSPIRTNSIDILTSTKLPNSLYRMGSVGDSGFVSTKEGTYFVNRLNVPLRMLSIKQCDTIEKPMANLDFEEAIYRVEKERSRVSVIGFRKTKKGKLVEKRIIIMRCPRVLFSRSDYSQMIAEFELSMSPSNWSKTVMCLIKSTVRGANESIEHKKNTEERREMIREISKGNWLEGSTSYVEYDLKTFSEKTVNKRISEILELDQFTAIELFSEVSKKCMIGIDIIQRNLKTASDQLISSVDEESEFEREELLELNNSVGKLKDVLWPKVKLEDFLVEEPLEDDEDSTGQEESLNWADEVEKEEADEVNRFEEQPSTNFSAMFESFEYNDDLDFGDQLELMTSEGEIISLDPVKVIGDSSERKYWHGALMRKELENVLIKELIPANKAMMRDVQSNLIDLIELLCWLKDSSNKLSKDRTVEWLLFLSTIRRSLRLMSYNPLSIEQTMKLDFFELVSNVKSFDELKDGISKMIPRSRILNKEIFDLEKGLSEFGRVEEPKTRRSALGRILRSVAGF